MKYFGIFLLAGLVGICFGQTTSHEFEIKDGSFWYNGKPMQIHSGEIIIRVFPENTGNTDSEC